jgi:hypothetical protein
MRQYGKPAMRMTSEFDRLTMNLPSPPKRTVPAGEADVRGHVAMMAPDQNKVADGSTVETPPISRMKWAVVWGNRRIRHPESLVIHASPCLPVHRSSDAHEHQTRTVAKKASGIPRLLAYVQDWLFGSLGARMATSDQ